MYDFFKSYRFQLIFRISLFFVLVMIFNFFLFNTDRQIVPLFILFCAGFAMLELIFFQEKQLHKVERHLVGLLHNDVTSLTTNLPKGRVFNSIGTSILALIKEIGDLRQTKKVAELFSEQIIAYAPDAILCYNGNGDIISVNKAFNKLLGVPHLSKIEQLEKFLPGINFSINRVETKGQSNFTFNKEAKECVVSLHHSTFVYKDNIIHILNLQEISSQLVGIEVDSWQKLIRVLAHEIINTVTPIASLANTLYTKTIQKIEDKHSSMYLQLGRGLETIDKRSKGLIKFVEHYRMFVVDPKLHYTTFSISTILNRITGLLEDTAKEKDCCLSVKVKKDFELQADMELLEQVLINLTLNSIDACREKPASQILITANINEKNHCVLRVIDEGIGITPEIKEKVFTPFFTTKEKGSGIGLSLSRQILHLHGGAIDIYSEVGKGTAITLELPLTQITT